MVRKTALWTGVAAAVAVPLVPLVHALLHPRKPVEIEESVFGLAVFAFDLLGSLSTGIMLFMWVVGLATVAVVASLVAFIAAWRARESRRIKLLCWVPMLLAGIGYGLIAALEG